MTSVEIGKHQGCKVCTAGNTPEGQRVFHVHPSIMDETKFGGSWRATLWRTDDDGNGNVVVSVECADENAARAVVDALARSYDAARFNAGWPQEIDDDGRRVRAHVLRYPVDVLI